MESSLIAEGEGLVMLVEVRDGVALEVTPPRSV